MALSQAAEDAFHSAIEAAYAMQEPEASAEDRALAYKAYAHFMEQYYWHKEQDEDWWDGECVLFPDSPRCKLYDV